MDLKLLKKWLDKKVHVDYLEYDDNERENVPYFEEGILHEIDLSNNTITIDNGNTITQINGNDIKQIYLKEK